MDSWIFKITDNACDTILVLGTGATLEDAENDALTKWDAAIGLRLDHAERLPRTALQLLSTIAINSELPALIV